jgi:hypothetical protein
MVEAGPRGTARVVEHSYAYTVSDAFIQERIELEGVELPNQWTISFSLQDLPDPGTRSRALALRRLYQDLEGEPQFEAPTDDPIEFLDRLEEWIASEKDLLDYEEGQRQQLELIAEQESREFEETMDAWIEYRGSYRLKTARKKRYKVTSTYARARGREELPGFWIDTAGSAKYRERVDPSAEALRAEGNIEEFLSQHGLQLQTRIIWLVEPPSGFEEVYDDWEFEQQEAILVTDYLGRYDAFLLIDTDYHAPVEVEDKN